MDSSKPASISVTWRSSALDLEYYAEPSDMLYRLRLFTKYIAELSWIRRVRNDLSFFYLFLLLFSVVMRGFYYSKVSSIAIYNVGYNIDWFFSIDCNVNRD